MKRFGHRKVEGHETRVLTMGDGRVASMFGIMPDGKLMLMLAEADSPFTNEGELDEFFDAPVMQPVVMIFNNKGVVEKFATDLLAALSEGAVQ